METMSLVEALATSASHAAEAQNLGHNILRACHNGRTGSYELSSSSGWASITHEFSTLAALVDYVETANRLETDATSGSGWRPL
jgi:putative lipase involved disintegration of autophagic bodies